MKKYISIHLFQSFFFLLQNYIMATDKAPDIHFTSWSPIISWSYRSDQDNCPICKSTLQAPCLDCTNSAESTTNCTVYICVFIMSRLHGVFVIMHFIFIASPVG